MKVKLGVVLIFILSSVLMGVEAVAATSTETDFGTAICRVVTPTEVRFALVGNGAYEKLSNNVEEADGCKVLTATFGDTVDTFGQDTYTFMGFCANENSNLFFTELCKAKTAPMLTTDDLTRLENFGSVDDRLNSPCLTVPAGGMYKPDDPGDPNEIRTTTEEILVHSGCYTTPSIVNSQ